MLYTFLIYWNESNPPEHDTLPGHFQFADDARGRGAYVFSEALGGTATATTLRPNAGKITTTDGPYVETKEALGGFYVLDCADLDEALDQGKRLAELSASAIEVRPVMDVPGWDYGPTAKFQRHTMG